jgi:DNA (cytosine-5)-methyltransferase 1
VAARVREAELGEQLGNVVDLFSGGGGMSYGFHAHPSFNMTGAADVEVGKPSTGHGAIGCNATYERNIGIAPLAVDLSQVQADELASKIMPSGVDELEILLTCPPCTGFSRAVSSNYVMDDPRNSLVAHAADFAAQVKPQIIMMENVPQLINGNFRHHFAALSANLVKLGYRVHASSHVLTEFGLPQQRERALVIAVAKGLPLYTLRDLWDGYGIRADALTVRRAISQLPPIGSGETHPDDPNHTSTHLAGDSLERIKAIPKNGGGWPDLLGDPSTERHLIPSMWKAVEKGRLNAYCDVYGRMWWDRPAATIKRECSHVGNGRYAHPQQDRQCTVREMANLQGFPFSYRFVGTSRKNLYRQVGDAVPPLISHQLAWVAHWILTGVKPDIEQVILRGTHLAVEDLVTRKSAGDQLVLV